MKKQSSIIWQTILALVLTQGLVILAVRLTPSAAPAGVWPVFSIPQLMVAFLVSTAVLLALVRLLRQRWILEGIFLLSIFSGVWFLAALIFPRGALIFAALIVALKYVLPVIAAHNVVLVLGIAGISAALGLTTTWSTAAAVLIILSLYDLVAVYGTKHMVTMFKGLLEQGIIFALIIPEHPRLLQKRLREVGPGENFFFLGTGDLALPGFFVAAAVQKSLALGLGAAAGSIIGLLFTDLLFARGRARPMPALPPIAFCTLAGFLIVHLFQSYV